MKLKNEKDSDSDVVWAGIGKLLVYGIGLVTLFVILVFAAAGRQALRDPTCHERLMMSK